MMPHREDKDACIVKGMITASSRLPRNTDLNRSPEFLGSIIGIFR